MIRDLVELAIRIVRDEQRKVVESEAQRLTEEQLIDVLLPPTGYDQDQDQADTDAAERRRRSREKLRVQLRSGDLEDRVVELTVETKGPPVGLMATFGMDQIDPDLQGLMERLVPPQSKTRSVDIREARKIVFDQQCDKLIDQCAELLDDSAADLSTLASPIASEADFNNPNVVKVILNERQEAIYFSRAPIPYSRNADQRDSARQAALHHHGIYAYRCSVLRRLVAANPSPLEIAEKLEQLRALSLGMIIRVGRPTIRPGHGVDTEEDLVTAARELAE